MKITFLLTQSLNDPGGSGRFFPIAKSLARQGHEVTILALHPDYARCEDRHFVMNGVEVRYVGQMHVRKIGGRKTYFGPLRLITVAALSTLRLTEAALRTPSDAIHVCKTQPMNGVAAWVVHLLRGTAVYLDSDDYEAGHNYFSRRWQQRIVAWFEDWMPSFASGITVNTTFIAERLERLGYPAERIQLVPNGVDRDRFAVLESPELPQMLSNLRRKLAIKGGKDRVIVYVGAMRTMSHAVDLLLDAFVGVIEAEPDALLLMVGGGKDLPLVQQRATDLGISHRVRFSSHIPAEKIPVYYRLAEVSVDPRRDSIPARSSLSLKLVESIAAGVPCVTADVGDRRRMLGSAGIAVEPGDPETLSEAILSILNDPERAEAMRAAARQGKESLFWDQRISQFISIYEEN